MNDLVKLFNFYAGKNFFLLYRYVFLRILSVRAKNVGLYITYEKHLKKDNRDLFIININDKVIISIYEFGNAKIIKNKKLNKVELKKLYTILNQTNNLIYLYYANSLINNNDLYILYCELVEAINNFRLTKKHLNIYLNAEINKNIVKFKDGNNEVSFKLLPKKLSVKKIWNKFENNLNKKIRRLKEYNIKDFVNFDLGKPFIFILKKKDIFVKGNPKNIINNINKFLYNYFFYFTKMNLYQVELTPVERSFVDIIILKGIKEKQIIAKLIAEKNVNTKNNLILNDEEIDEFIKILRQIKNTKKLKNIYNSLNKKFKNAKLIKVNFRNKGFFNKVIDFFKSLFK